MSLQKSEKILLIDDNEEMTRLISKYLKLKNYDIAISNNGKNGMSLILNQKFDIVLLDISMPEFNGFDVIDTLVREGKIANQKIIVFTAVDLSKEEIDGLLELGVSHCILKPVEINELVRMIESNNTSTLQSDGSFKIESHKIKELKQENIILKELHDYISNESNISPNFSLFSEEFRNSITPVAAYVDMLLAGHFGELNDKQKEKLRIIKENLSPLQKGSPNDTTSDNNES